MSNDVNNINNINNIDLNSISHKIETEFHALHGTVSSQTYATITNLVENNDLFNKVVEVNEDKTTLLSHLNPFSQKLFQIILNKLSNVNEDMLEHVICVMLVRGFTMFPRNGEIYLIYCIKKIDEDKNKFVNSCLTDITKRMDDVKNMLMKILIYFVVVVMVVAGMYLIKESFDVDRRKGMINGKL